MGVAVRSLLLFLAVVSAVGCGKTTVDTDSTPTPPDQSRPGKVTNAIPPGPLSPPAGQPPTRFARANPADPPVQPGRNPEPDIDRGTWKTRETVLLNAAQAREAVPGSFRVSPDGRRFAFVLNKSGGQVVVVDGVEQPTVYQKVADLRFGPDGADFAFSAIVNGTQRADRLNYNGLLPVVVLNGKRFNPQVTWRDLNRVIVGQWAVPELLALGEGKVLYTCHTAESPGSRTTEGVYLYVNDEILAPRPQGALAVGALVAEHRDRLKFARRDAARAAPGEAGVLSQDGSTWAVISREGPDQFPVINGEAKKRFPSVTGLTLSPDGTRYGHFASRPETGKSYYVIDGAVHELAPNTGRAIAFSPDGKRYAVTTSTAVLVDGVPQKQHDGTPSAVAFSPDGKRVAYAVWRLNRKDALGRDVYDPRYLLVIDGKEESSWPEIAGDIAWSPDSRSTAMLVRTAAGTPHVVAVNGRAWPQFDQTTPVGFSPDSRNHAAVVRHNEQQFAVLDGNKRTAYEEVGVGGSRVGFTPKGKLTYLARKVDNSIVWVEELRTDLADDEPVQIVKPAGDWQPLFNGKDLENWSFPDKSFDNYTQRTVPNKVTWLVENGAITFTGKDRSSLTSAGTDFKNFHLRMEVKTTPGARVAVVYANAVSAWIDNTRDAARTGSLTPLPRDLRLREPGVTEKLAGDGEWFTLEMLAYGGRVATRVNGKRAAVMNVDQTGPIAIAVEPAYPPPVAVRKIEYRPLSDDKELDAPGELRKPDPGPGDRPANDDPLLRPVAGFTPLFNGKDLTGWENAAVQRGGRWEVQDGKLVGTGTGDGAIYSGKEYADFHLRAVVRTGIDARGRLLVRAEKPAFDGTYYFAAFINNHSVAERTGEMRFHYRGGRQVWPPVKDSSAKDGEWVVLEVIAQGYRLVTKVNGEVVSDRTHIPVPLHPPMRSGRIGLFFDRGSKGIPVEVGRIDIKELK